MDEHESHSSGAKIDPKIIVALISGLVSIVSAMLPMLSDNERNWMLASAAILFALVLMGICVFILIQKKIYWGVGVLFLLVAGAVGSTFFARHVVPAVYKLSYADATVSVYAGTGDRGFRDGPYDECTFVAPAAMSAYQDKIYVVDSDRVRCLENGEVSTEPFPSSRYNALAVRNLESDLYVLAENRQADSGKYYNFFVRIRNGEAEPVSEMMDMGVFSASISDFGFSQGGVLWFIRLYNASGTASATLQKLSYDRDADRYGPPEWVMDLPYEAADMQDARMAFDAEDNLYISVPVRGVILRIGYGEQGCRIFAGVEDEHAFNDEGDVMFSYPTVLLPDGQRLYVLDNGTVRCLTLDGEKVESSETLAGVTPEVVLSGKMNIHNVAPGEQITGSEMMFPPDEKGALILDSRGHLLLSDPENSLIYQIWEN